MKYCEQMPTPSPVTSTQVVGHPQGILNSEENKDPSILEVA